MVETVLLGKIFQVILGDGHRDTSCTQGDRTASSEGYQGHRNEIICQSDSLPFVHFLSCRGFLFFSWIASISIGVSDEHTLILGQE